MNDDGPGDLSLLNRFLATRQLSEQICQPLEIEDYVVQPFAEVSPPKWHLAHTTWFFENFILKEYKESFQPFDEIYFRLFNSYYKSQGDHWQQGDRGSLSRPTVREIQSYRLAITSEIQELFNSSQALPDQALKFLELGIHHEQQHQELLLMDIKRIFWHNPNPPTHSALCTPETQSASNLNFIAFDEGLFDFGHRAPGFSYDNESPVHKHYLNSFALAHRPITNGEYLEFIKDGGYNDPLLWLSDAWDFVQSQHIRHPLYWKNLDDEYGEFQLSGFSPLNLNAFVSHLSFYEALAFARWKSCRLPTEWEWERAATLHPKYSHSLFLSTEALLSAPDEKDSNSTFEFLHGGLWEWTSSSYLPYPGYAAETGALGEYNSKFMNSQRVLRGGCYATPEGHYRPTYRNFYQAEKRWPFTGVRLAKEL